MRGKTAPQISEIEGLDSCSNLQCLSLGNNRIANLDSIIRLRRYPKLKLVNLEVRVFSRWVLTLCKVVVVVVHLINPSSYQGFDRVARFLRRQRFTLSLRATNDKSFPRTRQDTFRIKGRAAVSMTTIMTVPNTLFWAWQGNPVCREVEYRFTVLAYIKNITYHDYGTVDPAEVLQVRWCAANFH